MDRSEKNMMKRPVMDPMFLREEQGPPPRPGLVRMLLRTLFICIRLLFTDLAAWRREGKVREEGNVIAKLLRGFAYRVIFAPVVVVVVIALLVFWGTHPPRTGGHRDPLGNGTYYDPVSFSNETGTMLEGWLIPVLDAKRVINDGNAVLRRRHPAVVLVHDFAGSRYQMLPLVGPLHDAGFVVLAVSLRGCDTSGPGGCTFGLQEQADVEAAVNILRSRTFVDPERVAIVGIGTGANAALLAAEKDANIAALVLDRPVRNFEEVLDRMTPAQSWLSWMKPLCKWGFEFAYRVDAEDLAMDRRTLLLSSGKALLFGDADGKAGILREPQTSHVVNFLLHKTQPRTRTDVAGADTKPLGQ